MQRVNPLSIDLFPSLALDDEWLHALHGEIDEADDARQEWINNQRKLTEQRFGIKIGRRTVPFPGASDIRVPTQDKAIRRWKPKILSLVFDSEPVAYFRANEPGDVPAARIAEQYFDWYLKYHMEESLDEVCLLADLIAHRGFAFVQVSWDYRTEDETRVVDVGSLWPDGVEGLSPDEIVQMLVSEYDLDPGEIDPRMVDEILGGAERVVIYYRTTVADRARLTARDPVQVIAPARATDLENARFVAIQHTVDVPTLRQWVRDQKLQAAAVEDVVDHIQTQPGDSPSAEQNRFAERSTLDSFEGITQAYEDPESVRIWEIYTWSDRPERRRIVIWYHPASRTVLSSYPYPYPFHCWPLVRFDFERSLRRWSGSRGLTRMLSPLARSVDRLHNARLDAISVQLAPTFKWRAPSGMPPRAFQWGPGRVFPVTELSDFEAVQVDTSNLTAYTQEEYQTRQYAEDYAGLFDSSLMSPLRPQERRTATEVQLVAQTMQGSFSLDAKLFQKSMSCVYRLIWDLFLEFGPPNLFYRVQNEEMPLTLRKSDISYNFDIIPAGTPANTHRLLELAQIKEAMQFFMQDESGVIDRAELFRRYLELLNWNLSRRIINSPEEQRHNQILMQAAEQVASGQLQESMLQAQAAQTARVQGLMAPGAVPT